MVANQPMASSAQGSQRAPAARPGRPMLPPIVSETAGSDSRQRSAAIAEAFLLHVEIDGAADGGIHVGGGRPAEIASCGLDVGHAHLNVLVVLAVVLARGDIDDLGGAGVVAQHGEFLRDAYGTLRQ